MPSHQIKCSVLMSGFLLSMTAFAGVHPECRPIIQACKSAGFTVDGAQGHGLYRDCARLILTHQASATLPSISPAVVDACNAARAAAKQA